MYRTTQLFVQLALITLALSVCAGSTLFPNSISVQSGSSSRTDLSPLQTKDQSGSQDNWNNYVEFDSAPNYFSGVFSFDASNVTGAVSAFTLNVNFLGPQASQQIWQFDWFVPATNQWVFAGDNSAAKGWKWTSLSFAENVSFASIVNGNHVQLRLSSFNAVDNCDIDFLEIVVAQGAAPVTQAPQVPTTAPTQAAAASTKATSAPTAAPTHKATVTPTSAPTSAPTTKATAAPTAKATAAPTTKATAAPTAKATTKPTATPTVPSANGPAPTTPASNGPAPTNGRVCPADSHYQPGVGTSWQWQLTGTVDTSFDVQIYDIDMFGSSAALIAELHAAGRAVVCYIDTAYEPGRPDSAQFVPSVLGSGIDGWPGQYWTDIRSPIVRNIMAARMAIALGKGCDALEMDDVDAYENNPGFPLTAADQADFNTFLATTAHSLGLGIGLKNDIDQAATLAQFFDFAINEQCFQYKECTALNTFIGQGKAVLGVEYNLAATAFCTEANADQFSWLKKGLDLGAAVTFCCPTCTGTHTCVPTPTTARRSIAAAEEPAIIESVVSVPVEQVASAGSKISTFACVVASIALFAALL